MDKNTITVVSGLPRSGTSMMMKMLEAGGIPPVTEADVVVLLQALLDRHAMLRLRVDDDGMTVRDGDSVVRYTFTS